MKDLKGYKVECIDTETLRADLALFKKRQKLASQIVAMITKELKNRNKSNGKDREENNGL